MPCNFLQFGDATFSNSRLQLSVILFYNKHELETQLDIAFREEVKIFIRKYGVLIGYGVEIVACGLNGHSRFVEDTLRFRKNGLEKKYIVIEGDSELAYCLNNETGEIVNWGLDNFEVYPVAESLESFLLAQFEEGKRNWQ
jgi:hypothetical protein